MLTTNVEVRASCLATGNSNNSSSSDIAQLSAYDDQRTHHLLKHCLSDGQRIDALAQFGAADVKDAAKEISRMGQRELQSKFKLVYGTATHSNNNDWLRRKLYEAIGAAPIKAATKSKARKPAAKQRKANPSDSPLAVVHSLGALERRSRRLPKGTPKGLALAEMLKRHRPGAGSLPSSPVVGRSVLDMHTFLAHDATTTTSEDDSATWRNAGREQEDGEDGSDSREEQQHAYDRQNSGAAYSQHAAAVAAALQVQRQQAVRPQVVAPPAFGHSLPVPPPQLRNAQLPEPPVMRRASSAGLMFMSALSLDTFQSPNDAWGSDAWADAALQAAAARQPPALGYQPVDEDDELLLPMDMSVFDASATAAAML